MRYSDAIVVLGEQGVTYEIDKKTDCMNFYSRIGGKKVKLYVKTKSGDLLSDFCIDVPSQMIDLVEEFAECEMFPYLGDLPEDVRFSPECEACIDLEDKIASLELEIEHLSASLGLRRDYIDRYKDFDSRGN